MKKINPWTVFGISMLVLGIGLAAFSLWYLLGDSGTAYYVQVDSAKMEPGSPRNGVIDFSGGLPYKYTLPAYDGQGREKQLSFGTSKELRDGAYLRLTVKPVRGVIEWCEVQTDELPQAVQKVLLGS